MVQAILDTNVFLHFGPVGELSLTRIVGDSPVCVVITRQVVEELDREKVRGTSRSRERARRALRIIEGWAKEPEGAQVAPDVKAVVRLNVTMSRDRMMSANLDPDWDDDHLIGSALLLAGEGDRVVVVSDDTGARLRAAGVGIEAVALPDELRLPAERDEEQREFLRMRTELEALRSARPQVRVCFADGSDILRVDRSGPPERSAIAQSIERRTNEARTDVEAQLATWKAQPQNAFLMAGKNEVERFEKEVAEYPERIRQHLEAVARQREFEARSFEWHLVVENTGTAIATQIDVDLHFPDGFALTPIVEVDPLKPPRKPRPPRSIMELMRDQSHWPALVTPSLPRSVLRGLGGPPSPKIKETGSYHVEYPLEKVKHGHSEELGGILVIFPDFASIKSFGVAYRLTAAELPTAHEGRLDFVVEG
jgi:hypothetical protein